MKESIKILDIHDLYDFPDNPFKVQENGELQIIMESIQDYGIITPLVVRPRDEGGFEIISGHRRKAACVKVGIEKIPTFVRSMDNDTAIIALVDSNLHREHILPSEKAYAYKLKLDAIKRQGQRTDLTSRQVVGKLDSANFVGLETGESGRQVQRYIRLTELIPPILELVDEEKIAFNPAVELSFLTKQEQSNLLVTMESEEATPSLSQAQRMKKLSLIGALNMDAIFSIMTEMKPNQREQIKLKTEQIKDYFPKGYTHQQMEETIFKLLADWQRKRQQSRENSR